MQIGYAGKVDLDQPIRDAIAERPGKPIRLRIQPMILRGPAMKGAGGQYQGWKDVSWTLECDTADEAYAVREALRLFFQWMNDKGPLALYQHLGSEAGELGPVEADETEQPEAPAVAGGSQ